MTIGKPSDKLFVATDTLEIEYQPRKKISQFYLHDALFENQVRKKHPEDVVDEEQAQKNRRNFQVWNAHEGERRNAVANCQDCRALIGLLLI
jgi:hypothetical protein